MRAIFLLFSTQTLSELIPKIISAKRARVSFPHTTEPSFFEGLKNKAKRTTFFEEATLSVIVTSSYNSFCAPDNVLELGVAPRPNTAVWLSNPGSWRD